MITAESPLSRDLYTVTLILFTLRDGICLFLLYWAGLWLQWIWYYVTLEAGSQGDKLPPAYLGTLVFEGLGHRYVIKATPLCQATWRGHKGVAHSPRWVPRWQPADAIGVKTPPSDFCLPLSITSSCWVLPVEASDIIEKKQTAHCAFSEFLTHRIYKQN